MSVDTVHYRGGMKMYELFDVCSPERCACISPACTCAATYAYVVVPWPRPFLILIIRHADDGSEAVDESRELPRLQGPDRCGIQWCRAGGARVQPPQRQQVAGFPCQVSSRTRACSRDSPGVEEYSVLSHYMYRSMAMWSTGTPPGGTLSHPEVQPAVSCLIVTY